MEMIESDLVLNLKGLFFDILDAENGLQQHNGLLNEMLLVIKKVVYAEEATLYISNHWKQHLYLEESTNDNNNNLLPEIISSGEIIDLARKQTVFRGNIPLPGFEREDLLIVLSKEDNYLGAIFLKEKEEGNFSQFKNEELSMLGNECVVFLEKAQSLGKVVMEEKRYKQLFRVTEKFHSSMDMDAVLVEIISTLKEVYPTFTYYLLLSQDNHSHSELPIKDLEYDSENIAAMQAYVTGDFQFEDSLIEKRSILYAPLKGKQGVYGVLQVIAPDTLIFPANEVEFITLLAITAGSALENAQLYQQSKRLISDLQLINETSHKLNSNLRLTETMGYMCEQIMHSFQAEEVGFFLLSAKKDKLKILPGSTDFFFSEQSEIYIDFMKDKIQKEKDSLFIGDLGLKEAIEPFFFRSIMAVPMVQSDVLKGFAIVIHREPYHFSFENFKLLQSLIHHSTLAFVNSMLREELEKMVITDHLTKLHSRNHLNEKIHLSMEEEDQGTFILIDIDNFKAINDTYGHQVGDDVIIQVANIIQRNIRGTDVGARWGGEELAIYLPNIPLHAGVYIAERLVKTVEESSKPQITISCGVSYWNKDKKDSVKYLFKRADEALYLAKRTGKNKVITQDDSIKAG
jgi:diguanylate cyclase (GGDEF)-like protein